MRTTVTLEADVAERLRELAYRRRSSFKATLNEVIRRGLAAQERSEALETPFRVVPHQGGFRPGVDVGKLNQLADQIEMTDFLGEGRTST